MKVKPKTTAKKAAPVKKTRLAIPENIKLKVWNESGGRCEFRACNEPLWYNKLTLSNANFGKLAHIIGASEKGPRGGKDSKKLERESTNIMLLCQRCHDEIDNSFLSKKYPTEFLREMKSEHETRIKSVTEITHNRKTEILIFKANIDKRQVDISADEAKHTIIKEMYYPKGDGFLLDLTFGKGDGELNYWELTAEQIEERIKADIKQKGIGSDKIEHLSIFALAPIPLLVVLGKAISDTYISKVDLYQRHRDTQDWHWKNTKDKIPTIKINKPSKNNLKHKVVLVLSISDYVGKDKFPEPLKKSTDVFEITIDSIPNTHFLKNKEQIAEFEKCFREALNEIQLIYGKDKEVHILPAIPAPIAIKCGMTLLPKKDAPIILYDFNKEHNGMRGVLKI